MSTLSELEALLVVDALQGQARTFDAKTDLLLAVDDGVKLEGLDEKWQVDGSALLITLQKMTPEAAENLYEGVECFWCCCSGETHSTRVRGSGMLSVYLWGS